MDTGRVPQESAGASEHSSGDENVVPDKLVEEGKERQEDGAVDCGFRGRSKRFAQVVRAEKGRVVTCAHPGCDVQWCHWHFFGKGNPRMRCESHNCGNNGWRGYLHHKGAAERKCHTKWCKTFWCDLPKKQGRRRLYCDACMKRKRARHNNRMHTNRKVRLWSS